MWFEVITNYRTFLLEADCIGSAIDAALAVIVSDRGEYLRSVDVALVIVEKVAA